MFNCNYVVRFIICNIKKMSVRIQTMEGRESRCENEISTFKTIKRSGESVNKKRMKYK